MIETHFDAAMERCVKALPERQRAWRELLEHIAGRRFVTVTTPKERVDE